MVFYVFLCRSVCLFLYGPFCYGALKLDMSTFFTTFFLWTSLQFILKTIPVYRATHLYMYNHITFIHVKHYTFGESLLPINYMFMTFISDLTQTTDVYHKHNFNVLLTLSFRSFILSERCTYAFWVGRPRVSEFLNPWQFLLG